MKKFIYFLCCLASACVLGYMIYNAWGMVERSRINRDTIMWILGTIGWCCITYNILTNSYSWTKALCK